MKARYYITIVKNNQRVEKPCSSVIDLNKQLGLYRRKNVLIDDVRAVR